MKKKLKGNECSALCHLTGSFSFCLILVGVWWPKIIVRGSEMVKYGGGDEQWVKFNLEKKGATPTLPTEPKNSKLLPVKPTKVARRRVRTHGIPLFL